MYIASTLILGISFISWYDHVFRKKREAACRSLRSYLDHTLCLKEAGLNHHDFKLVHKRVHCLCLSRV